MDEYRADLMQNEETILDELDRLRPQRYGDLNWADSPRDQLASLYKSDPDFLDDLAEIHAAEVIARTERHALRSVSKVMSLIARDGVLPLDFMDVARRPIEIDGEKVRVDSTTSKDWRQWADEKAERAGRNHATEMHRCDNARRLADLLDESGAAHLFDLPMEVAP